MAEPRSVVSCFRVGVISDTHGLLRPEALRSLQDADHIIHAGDIGTPTILDELRRIAPLTVVRGNNDTGEWAKSLPDSALVELAGVSIYVLHDFKELGKYENPGNACIVIAGHSHKPLVELKAGRLHLNPGSAGPRRFSLPVTLATLTINEGEPRAEIVHLL